MNGPPWPGLQIYKERKHLAFTLADAKSVVARLEFLLGVAAHAVAALLYLLIFRVRLWWWRSDMMGSQATSWLVHRHA